jgi:diguanylate cyclase (GGDEF)-like protein
VAASAQVRPAAWGRRHLGHHGAWEHAMPAAPPPGNELERLAALESYEVLDSACEASFDNIVRLAARLTGSPIALVSLVDADRQWFKARFGLDENVSETHRDLAFCAHAILDPSQPLIVPDATKDARFSDNALVTGAPDIRFYAGVPLVNPDGFALGTLCVIDRQPKEFAAEDLDTLSGLAQAVMTTLELRRALQKIGAVALTDGLTGLLNRRGFLVGLNQAIARQHRDGRPFSLLYIDLDRFKEVNDRFGHSTGDRVLTEIADAMRRAVRTEDTVARIGGDEFGIVLVGGDGTEASGVGERVRKSIQHRMQQGGWGVTASVGAVAFHDAPDDQNMALTLADDLMYRAKMAGRNRVESLCHAISPISIDREEPARTDGPAAH